MLIAMGINGELIDDCQRLALRFLVVWENALSVPIGGFLNR